jgi:DNA polymerase III subunit gamma/tau
VASLYRRHRPRTFADVVGQEHVVRTLSNAVEQGRVHHAYLFVGSRGTGKTSMAKILAASLNCQNGGPTVTPCGQCESCVSIAAATSLDVVEMDAASNNSVDDIRDLRERVGYAPVGGRHKVYILDEAHMLTTAAWNAFLKTLEEPPPHTIFVLATTEANKVLPTVVDRCHRFDFARPGVPQIAAVLRRVADAESIVIPDEAVALVARAATGSFRDALGTLEQLVAYSGSTVALDDVLAVLGAADADLLFGAVDAVASGDAAAALRACARLADSGRDLGRFFGDLEAHARGLMVAQVLGSVPPELSVTPEQDERLAEQARRVAPADVVRLLELIAGALRAMKDGADARTQLELALVKAATPDLEPSVKALHARLERLESRAPAPPARHDLAPATAAGRAAQAPPGPTPAPQPAAASPQAPPAPQPAAASAQAPPSASPPSPASQPVAPTPPAPASSSPSTPAEPAPAASLAAAPGPDAPPPGRTAVAVTAQVEGQPPVAASTSLPGAPPVTAQEAQVAADRAAAAVAEEIATEADPTPAVAAVAVVDPAAPGTAPTFSAGVELSLEAFGDVWPAVVDSLRADAPMLASLLEDAQPASLAGEGLTLAWPESSAFSKRKAEDPANRELIAGAIRAVTGSSLRLAYELRADHEVVAAAGAAEPAVSEEELVERFKREFEAEELPPEPEEQT